MAKYEKTDTVEVAEEVPAAPKTYPKRENFSHRDDHYWQELVDGTWINGRCEAGKCLKNKAAAPWVRDAK